MDDVFAKAIQSGNYDAAYQALQRTPEASTIVGVEVGGILLAFAERFDEADRLLATQDLGGIATIARGERQRLARWRDVEGAKTLAAATPIEYLGVYVEMAGALLAGDVERVKKIKVEIARRVPPVAGRIFLGGQPRAFKNLVDADDAIGQMLETYCGAGLLYFPFASLRRVDFMPKKNFMDFLLPKVQVTTVDGTSGLAYVPLLYAGSSTHEDETTRNGRMTMFDYIGEGRRARGQRDFFADQTTMIGLQNVTAIEFDN